jgi:hypothetical protein
MSYYEFSAICETCGVETTQSKDFLIVSRLAKIHSVRRPGHILLYRNHTIEGKKK